VALLLKPRVFGLELLELDLELVDFLHALVLDFEVFDLLLHFVDLVPEFVFLLH
jgi:hypothetical protein